MHNDKLSRRGVEWEELPYIGYITCVTVKGKVFSDLILEFYFILLSFVYQKDTLAQCAQLVGGHFDIIHKLSKAVSTKSQRAKPENVPTIFASGVHHQDKTKN